jgi:adenine/guanine phosphoribosyltransferase-like PRPP-binding protein
VEPAIIRENHSVPSPYRSVEKYCRKSRTGTFKAAGAGVGIAEVSGRPGPVGAFGPSAAGIFFAAVVNRHFGKPFHPALDWQTPRSYR